MLKAVNKTITSKFDSADTETINCDDLCILANLWEKHSGGHFGFLTQAKIYQEVQEDYISFSKRVGWNKGNQWVGYSDLHWPLDGSLDAPLGHLPWIQGRFLYHSSHPSFNFNPYALALGDICFGVMKKFGAMGTPVIHSLVNKIRNCDKNIRIS